MAKDTMANGFAQKTFLALAKFPHEKYPTVTQITSWAAVVVAFSGAISDAIAPGSALFADFHAVFPRFHIPSRVYFILVLTAAVGNSIIKALSRPPKPGETYQAGGDTQSGASDAETPPDAAQGASAVGVTEPTAPADATEDAPSAPPVNQTLTPAFVAVSGVTAVLTDKPTTADKAPPRERPTFSPPPPVKVEEDAPKPPFNALTVTRSQALPGAEPLPEDGTASDAAGTTPDAAPEE